MPKVNLAFTCLRRIRSRNGTAESVLFLKQFFDYMSCKLPPVLRNVAKF